MQEWPDLRAVLTNARWAVAGGVATRAFMPERMTQDLDIVVHPDDLEPVVALLAAAGFVVGEALAVPGRTLRSPDGIEVDVLEGRFPWIDEAFGALATDPSGLPVLDLPYLILMTLAASRTIDLGDITRMLGLASDGQLDAVRRAVGRFMPDDAGDLETMIYLGREEMGPPAG